MIALVAIWLAMRRPENPWLPGTLAGIDDRLTSLDARIAAALGPEAPELPLGWSIVETLDLAEVLERTLKAAHEIEAVTGSRVSVPLPDGTSVEATDGVVVAATQALGGPPDGSEYVHGFASWETQGADAIHSGLVVPLSGGSLSVYGSREDGFGKEAAAVLAAIARRAAPAVRNAIEHRRVIDEAATDALTGVGSARAFAEALPRSISAARRGGRPLCLIQLDLDDFKRINDEHPRHHAAGNDALAGFGATVRSTLRTTDEAFRNSGGADEFFVILADTAIDAARRTYRRLEDDLVDLRFGPDRDVGPLSMSGGLAELRPATRLAR